MGVVARKWGVSLDNMEFEAAVLGMCKAGRYATKDM